ncbi:hypothetical protein INT45_009669 [Circinella minor]|uniref:SWIM-type domain-containing protein n=1 Tax=Circinella minor TaxID=1195481 RepID=A0A8H7RT71_9FUNG|nr:hypothetical protein INT45_009669 [Circinella minor]
MLKVVNRAEKLEWELEFVREWHVKTGRSDPGSNSRGTRAENPNADQLYLPSLENWTCGCPSFATSHFMLCKQVQLHCANSYESIGKKQRIRQHLQTNPIKNPLLFLATDSYR